MEGAIFHPELRRTEECGRMGHNTRLSTRDSLVPSREHRRLAKKILFKGKGRLFSPPFEGGVAGMIDYVSFTRLISRPGWLIGLFLSIFTSMLNNNIFNRKELKHFRATLRKNSTSAEAKLWEMLKSRNMDGKKFRRQYSISNYIVDFCCPEKKLIIELDGAPHREYHQSQKDENRDKYLERLGFVVVRFENRIVFQHPEYLKSEIKKHLYRKIEQKYK